MYEPTSTADLLAHYKAVHARLSTPPPDMAPTPKPVPREAPAPPRVVLPPVRPRANQASNLKMPKTTRPEMILKLACQLFGVPRSEMIGPGRRWKIVNLRFIAIGVTHELLPQYGLQRIGRTYNRDHTSVLHARQQAARRRDTDSKFAERYNELLKISWAALKEEKNVGSALSALREASAHDDSHDRRDPDRPDGAQGL